MRVRIPLAACCAAIVSLAIGSTAAAQYSTIAANRIGMGDGFYESIGVGFAMQFGNGGFFNFGGPAPVPFGGGNAGGGATFGFQGPNYRLNLYADQGSNRTLSSNSASVMVPNGGTGSIFSGTVRPFVTGIVPIVAQTSPVLQRYHRLMQQGGLREYAEEHGMAAANASSAEAAAAGLNRAPSSAERGDFSIAEIRRQQAEEAAGLREESLALVREAERCIREGKPGAARVYLQQAARRAEGSEKKSILAKLESLR